MARVIAGPPCLRPTKQRLDLRNGEAACLRECSGLSFGPSLRVKPPSRAWRTAQSRSTPFALTVAAANHQFASTGTKPLAER
jgi:hypothetical protein